MLKTLDERITQGYINADAAVGAFNLALSGYKGPDRGSRGR